MAPTPVTVHHHAQAPATPSFVTPTGPAAFDETVLADDSASEAEAEATVEAKLSSLGELSEDERQSLVDRYVEAEAECAHWAGMLEGGPTGRQLGEGHPDVWPERLELEREMAETARSEGAGMDEDGVFSQVQLGEHLSEIRAEYESELGRCYDEVLERVALIQEEVQAAGVPILALQALLREQEAAHANRYDAGSPRPSGAEAQQTDAGSATTAASVRCERCRMPGARPWMPPPSADSSAATESDGPTTQQRDLCYVCSAEAEIEASRPLQRKHGRVCERGATGFDGWTRGMTRTSDAAALKAMYKAKRPRQLEALASQLMVETAMEVDELESDAEDEHAAAESGGRADRGDARRESDSSGSDSEDERPPAVGAARRPSKRQLRTAWEAERAAEHPVVRRRSAKRDRADRLGTRMAACTSCGHPFFEDVEVFSHPLLGTAQCHYCTQAVRGLLESVPGTDVEEPDEELLDEPEEDFGEEEMGEVHEDETCCWCAGQREPSADSQMLGCELAGCDRWFCSGCVRTNLGDEAVARATATSPWACFVCDPSALASIRLDCAQMRDKRTRARERREAQRLPGSCRAGGGEGSAPGLASKFTKAEMDELPASGKYDRTGAHTNVEFTGGAVVLWADECAANRRSAGSLPAVDVEPSLASLLKPHQVSIAAVPRTPNRCSIEAQKNCPIVTPASAGVRTLRVPRTRSLGPCVPCPPAVMRAAQVEGVRFIWAACLAPTRKEASKQRKEHGCVLAHSMGLGKTLTVIAFLHTALTRAKNAKGKDYVQFHTGREPHAVRPSTALILVPKAVHTQWQSEFDRWLGADSGVAVTALSPGSGQVLPQLRRWRQDGGALIVTHNHFLQLLSPPRACKHAVSFTEAKAVAAAACEAAGLLTSGADVMIMDEAHRIKNDKSALAQALARVMTHRRVLLTGTPLQNNLREYYHMVSYVRPGALGKLSKFRKLFEETIQAGSMRTDNETEQASQRKRMSKRVYALSKKLDSLVQRRGVGVLHKDLPPKHEFVLTVRLGETQRQLYNAVLGANAPELNNTDGGEAAAARGRASAKGGGVFALDQELRRVYNHPAAMLIHHQRKLAERAKDAPAAPHGAFEAEKLPAEEVFTRTNPGHDLNEPCDDCSAQPWWRSLWRAAPAVADACEPHLSGKISIALELLSRAVAAGERTLVFSQSLDTLSVLEHVLASAAAPGGGDGGWRCGLDYLRFDGKTEGDDRDAMVKAFNAPISRLKAFLISTRAGGIGLNLTAASRVIIVDANWNPSHDLQALYRAYRYGQRRPVHVYRLIAEGFEECMYRQQVLKLQLAGRVLDEQTLESHYTQDEIKNLCRPLYLSPGSFDPAQLDELPTESWLREVAAGGCGAFLSQVEDHCLQLEHDEEEALSTKEREEAANDLLTEALSEPRDETETRCAKCDTTHADVSFSTLLLTCKACGAPTPLPPAPPLIYRPTVPAAGSPAEAPHLYFLLHGERMVNEQVLSLLRSEAGVYTVQWREVSGGDHFTADEGWVDCLSTIPRGVGVVQSGPLVAGSRHQVRVRARLSGCECGVDPETGCIACADKGACMWTPWSLPSVATTALDE